MGYRSDVKLILTDKGMNMLKARIKKPTRDEPHYLAKPIYEATKLKDKYWLIEWYSAKWYDYSAEYAVPYAVAQVLAELDDIKEPYSCMRVGEDYGDVDIIYCDGENWRDHTDMPSLWLKREIEVEY